ncbi:MAG: hypothetical protein SPE66_00375, partial [Bilifractor sp.]|nr:hypothetical protein [Bilifractor sp.]
MNDANMYEHGAMRSNARMLIHVAAARVAKQRSSWLYTKSSRNVLGPWGACSPVGKNISDDNRYEHEAVRS